MSIKSVMPSNHLILCQSLLLPPSIFPNIRVFSKKSVLRIRWPMFWSFSFSISPSNEYSGLISFRIDWFDYRVVQGIGYPLQYSWASLLAQQVKNPPAVWETCVRSLGWEDPLEKGKATHYSILGWRIPWTIQLQSQT